MSSARYRPNDINQYIGRIDFNPSQWNQIYLVSIHEHNGQTRTLPFTGATIPGFRDKSDTKYLSVLHGMDPPIRHKRCERSTGSLHSLQLQYGDSAAYGCAFEPWLFHLAAEHGGSERAIHQHRRSQLGPADVRARVQHQWPSAAHRPGLSAQRRLL